MRRAGKEPFPVIYVDRKDEGGDVSISLFTII